MDKSIDARDICSIIKNLFEKAESTKAELELSVNDTLIYRREAGIENYRKYLNNYNEFYRNKKEMLLCFVDSEVLLEFIIEQAISNPTILIDLAKKLNVSNNWANYPIREILDPSGMRLGY